MAIRTGSEILLKATVIDNDDQFGPELKVEVMGFRPEKRGNDKIAFWINPDKNPFILGQEKK